MSNVITVNGEDVYINRWRYWTDKEFAFVGDIVGWLGEDGSIVSSVRDRLQAPYLLRDVNGNLIECKPFAYSGFQELKLEDALTLGFNTSEYQAGLRRQMLAEHYLQSERELGIEQLPPRNAYDAWERQGCEDWASEWDPLRRVPYPKESQFERYEVIGWVESELAEGSSMPDDRFQAEFRLRDNNAGKVFTSGHNLAEIGLESMSIKDALTLGFSTLEYNEALRTRLLERRHLVDEADLAEGRNPPHQVRSILDEKGRECTSELDPVYRHYKRSASAPASRQPTAKEQLWLWLTRRDRPHPKKVSQQDPFEYGVTLSARKR